MRKARDYCVVVVSSSVRLCVCVRWMYDKIDDEKTTTMVTSNDKVHTKLFTQSRAHSAIVLYKLKHSGSVNVYLSTSSVMSS